MVVPEHVYLCRMLLRKTLSEYGCIRNADDYPDGIDSFSEIFLPGPVFRQLCELAGHDDADTILQLSWQKGRETLRTKNYVGLLETPHGVQLEILPKIALDQPEPARRSLLRMLRRLSNSPFRSIANAHTRSSQLPLWEIFITIFLDEVDLLVSQGIQQTYRTVDGNESFWKGKFLPHQHLRRNLYHAGRVAVRYDKRTPDTPPNRILKTTLERLRPRTGTLRNQARIRQLLQAFDDVSLSDSLPVDWQLIRTNSRQENRYTTALGWAKALLQQEAFGVRAGTALSLALLFPMERIFEQYVTHGFRQYWPSGSVSAQESSMHLVDHHVGTPKFKLRPDLVIRQGDQTVVLDTKWKQINGHDRKGNYGIDTADLYQLYAYGKKYSARDLMLLYPANPTFQEPLDVFGYDPDTRLHVVPFDVTQPLVQEVEKIHALTLSFQTK